MAFFPLWQLKTALVIALVLFAYSASNAEVRVIVEYDNTEHRLLRVVDLPVSRSAPVSDHLRGKSKDSQQSAAEDSSAAALSKVKLLWFDANGEMISSALIDDPRLTHAPLTGTDQSPTVVSLKAGAFVVSGPSESTVLEIHLPANVPLGLGRQYWRMMLVR